jgi:hypothetical protein
VLYPKLPGRRWLHKHRRPLQQLHFLFSEDTSKSPPPIKTARPAVSPCSRDISPTMSYYQGRYDDRSPNSGPYQGRPGQYSQQPAHQGPPQIICEYRVNPSSKYRPNPSETNFIKEPLVPEPLSNTSAQHKPFQPLFVAFSRFMQRRLSFYRH